jgi:polynucleotide 5'-hydroxyl-kinase GRC3/NOL9
LIRTVERGKTLLVDGPASATLVSGRAEVFGFTLAESRKIIIREGKRLPFHVLQTAQFELSLGTGSSASEVEGDTIPQSWAAAYSAVRGTERKPVAVMVFGGVDSGKSSFCSYLTNRLVSDGGRVAILDEDLGQSDVGPPATIAYALVTKPVTDLFNLKPARVVFVGSTSPTYAVDDTVRAVATLKTEAVANVDFLVVNTDGWTMDEEAVRFKACLASVVEPDVVFCLEPPGPVPSLCSSFEGALEGFTVQRVASPPLVRERDREKRKSLRELGFAKYLAGAKLRVVPLSFLTIESKEPAEVTAKHGAENLLVALYDKQERFLGIGVFRAFDYRRKALKIQTAVAETPALVVFGRTRLDENLREIP